MQQFAFAKPILLISAGKNRISSAGAFPADEKNLSHPQCWGFSCSYLQTVQWNCNPIRRLLKTGLGWLGRCTTLRRFRWFERSIKSNLNALDGGARFAALPLLNTLSLFPRCFYHQYAPANLTPRAINRKLGSSLATVLAPLVVRTRQYTFIRAFIRAFFTSKGNYVPTFIDASIVIVVGEVFFLLSVRCPRRVQTIDSHGHRISGFDRAEVKRKPRKKRKRRNKTTCPWGKNLSVISRSMEKMPLYFFPSFPFSFGW